MKPLGTNYDCDMSPVCMIQKLTYCIDVSFKPGDGSIYPDVSFFIPSRQELTKFKDNFLKAYRAFIRKETKGELREMLRQKQKGNGLRLLL